MTETFINLREPQYEKYFGTGMGGKDTIDLKKHIKESHIYMKVT